MTVGRGVGNDLVLDDQSMSRKHAKIKRLGNGRIEVEDLAPRMAPTSTVARSPRRSVDQGTPFDSASCRSASTGQVAAVAPGKASKAVLELRRRLRGPSRCSLRSRVRRRWSGCCGSSNWQCPAARPKRTSKRRSSKRSRGQQKITAAKDALDKSDFAKAKDLAEQGLETDPANLDGIRIRAQASRAIDDESKHRQGVRAEKKNNPDGFTAALRIYDSMSLDSKSGRSWDRRCAKADSPVVKSSAARSCTASVSMRSARRVVSVGEAQRQHRQAAQRARQSPGSLPHVKVAFAPRSALAFPLPMPFSSLFVSRCRDIRSAFMTWLPALLLLC